MKFAVILPNTKLYGGVKRFFELGDVLIEKGHTFFVFSPEGKNPEWYSGNVQTFRMDEISSFDLDVGFVTETRFLSSLFQANAERKILYFVRPSDSLGILKKYPGIEVFANSTNTYDTATKHGIEAFKAYGGINTRSYYPKEILPNEGEPFIVMTYGRIVEKKKGTRLVVKACERLHKRGYNVKLLLFDTPVNEKAKVAIDRFNTSVPFEFVLGHPVERNVELYHRADIFVSAEKKAGYSNTSAEAMASGLPVIGTSSGTKDFLIHEETGIVVSRWSWRIASAIASLIDDVEMRKKLGLAGRKKIEEFSWNILADRIVKYFEGNSVKA
ncbi:MAG TPA: glycosyltransferase family 4 protein [Chryseosolibacter sp.]